MQTLAASRMPATNCSHPRQENGAGSCQSCAGKCGRTPWRAGPTAGRRSGRSGILWPIHEFVFQGFVFRAKISRIRFPRIRSQGFICRNAFGWPPATGRSPPRRRAGGTRDSALAALRHLPPAARTWPRCLICTGRGTGGKSRSLCIPESLTRANRQERTRGPKDPSRQERYRC